MQLFAKVSRLFEVIIDQISTVNYSIKSLSGRLHSFWCISFHSSPYLLALSLLQVKLPTKADPDLERPESLQNSPPEGKHTRIIWAPKDAPLLRIRGAPNSAGQERVLRRNNTGWQVGGAPQIDVRVNPVGPNIAQCRVYCAVPPTFWFMRLRPTLGFSSGNTINLTPVKTKLKGKLWIVGWRVAFLWSKILI